MRNFNLRKSLWCALVGLLLVPLCAQQTSGPISVDQALEMVTMPSIASKSASGELEEPLSKGFIEDGRAYPYDVVIGKDKQTQDDALASNPSFMKNSIPAKVPEVVFNGYDSGSSPTDPSLAVGPNHVFVVFNTGFRIFDKDGNPLTGETAATAIFPGNPCCDLTVSYDNAADRWVLSILYTNGDGIRLAVSDGPDPMTANWNVYQYSAGSDYQKLSVWSDGYYMTENTGEANNMHVFERDEMLAGNPAAKRVSFGLPNLASSGFFSPQAFNVTNGDLPAPGNAPVVYLQDDAFPGVTADHLKVWTINVDWANTANSTISAPTELPVTPFIGVFDGGSFSNLDQPNGGASIDAMQATVMNQAQFRKFPSHNSAVFTFVVDADASAGELAAIRWYELRQDGDGQPWYIYQEGTYQAPDDKHAWVGTVAMDKFGNIGMGYTGMGRGNTNFTEVSSYYTGRRSSDPLGEMTVEEQLIFQGIQAIPNLRYCDYAKVDVDPIEEREFYFITELIDEVGSTIRDGIVGRFQIAPDFNIDVAPVAITAPTDGILGASESVTVQVTNLGLDEQSNIPLTLSVDGTLVATETLAGPVASGATVPFTFAATVDLSTEGQTYTLEVSSTLSGDEDSANDTFSANVTNVPANEVGVASIDSPVTGPGLGLEDVTISITNFGFSTQSNIPVFYSVNGGTQVNEVAPGPIAYNETVQYTFSQKADLSALGEYTIEAGTDLSGDSVPANDVTSKVVASSSCITDSNTESFLTASSPFTFEAVINISNTALISDLNLTIDDTGISGTGWENTVISLVGPDNTEVILYDGPNAEPSGIAPLGTPTFDDEAVENIQDQTMRPLTGAYQPAEALSAFNGMSTAGDWTLKFTKNGSGGIAFGGWTLQICSLESLSTITPRVDNDTFTITDMGADQFRITMGNIQPSERVDLKVYDMSGRILKAYTLPKSGEKVDYILDMSYAKSGVYIVKLGSKTQNNVGRIIVE